MINIKSKEYNLTSLFQYDLLREILLSLAENQNDINSEIIALKNQNKYQDFRLSKLEEKNNIISNPLEFNIDISNKESKNVESRPNPESISKNEEKGKDIEKEKEEDNNINKEEKKSTEEQITENKEQNNDKQQSENSDEEEDLYKYVNSKRKKRMSTKFGDLINDNFIANYTINNGSQFRINK